MPHTAVDFSDPLADSFDRRAFALELHELTAEMIDAPVDSCKTRFRRMEGAVIADGSPGRALVHVELAILPGRSEEAKACLSRAVLELVTRHTATADGTEVHASVEVRDLDASYSKGITLPR
ncbi:5-carboxymethyl-2-hydroxymuconate Delta-isomerase [Streptomyces sp. NPDC002537]